jgi:uncharacterized protein YukJ
MPEANYGVLKAHPLAARMGTQDSHYHIDATDSDGVEYRIAVNVASRDDPPELLYHASDRFRYPTEGQQAQLESLTTGFTALSRRPGGLAIDYQRGGLLGSEPVSQLFMVENEDTLQATLDRTIQRAIADPAAVVCAFGSHWYEPDKPDEIFGFTPGNGIHDIHLNQGNDARFSHEDGTWQDGALLIYQPATAQWSAIFLMFQTQVLPTDDNGHRRELG